MIYKSGNAIAEWLGLNSWLDIAMMQEPDRVEEFRQMVENAV